MKRSARLRDQPGLKTTYHGGSSPKNHNSRRIAMVKKEVNPSRAVLLLANPKSKSSNLTMRQAWREKVSFVESCYSVPECRLPKDKLAAKAKSLYEIRGWKFAEDPVLFLEQGGQDALQNRLS